MALSRERRSVIVTFALAINLNFAKRSIVFSASIFIKYS